MSSLAGYVAFHGCVDECVVDYSQDPDHLFIDGLQSVAPASQHGANSQAKKHRNLSAIFSTMVKMRLAGQAQQPIRIKHA